MHRALYADLSQEQRDILLLLAMIPPPVSLDVLVGVTPYPPVRILQLIDDLLKKAILTIHRPSGAGFYHFKKTDEVSQILANAPQGHLQQSATKLIEYFEKAFEQGPKRWLAITHVYEVSGLMPRNLSYCLKSGQYCLERGLGDQAADYFRLAIKGMPAQGCSPGENTVYVKAVLGLTQARGHMIPLIQQDELLTSARQYANQIENLELLARVDLVHAQVLKSAGDYPQAAHFYDEGWDLATKLGQEELLKWAALCTSDFLHWQGRIKDAVERYEQVIGNLEDFPSDEDTLRACACLGWCYGICGQIARGIGLIETVRSRALKRNLPRVKIYADIMTTLICLDYRRIPEVEAYVTEILSQPPEMLGLYDLWTANAAMAYVKFYHGDLESCFEFQKKAYDKSRELGWPHHRGPWNFEYLDALEKVGFVHPGMNYQSEIERILKWPDIYMQGVGLRYRALRALENKTPEDRILADLEKSQELLSRAGANLELSRTRILMARVLLAQGQREKAQALLAPAWKAISAGNEELFPSDLKRYVIPEDREQLLLDTVVEAGNTLGTVRNKAQLLERFINLIMQFTKAERGGFFLLGPEGELEMKASRNLDLAMV
ncbi:MAG: hypothetical protein PVG03_05960, partial [Desulfarculaceae bacterium]